MEIQSAFADYKLPETKKAPNSERSFWIQQIADLTEMKFMVIFGKVSHLPTNWVKDIYEDAMTAEGKVSKIKKCWWLINKTKV